MTIIPQKYGELIPLQTIEGVAQLIAEHFSPQKIILFGSYATGQPTPDSDLDLIVVMPTDLPKYRRSLAMHLLFEPSPCAMDILVFTPDEVDYWYGTANHVITHAMQIGRILYEQ